MLEYSIPKFSVSMDKPEQIPKRNGQPLFLVVNTPKLEILASLRDLIRGYKRVYDLCDSLFS
jgi:hypothetical protein